jgi:hypothetical protein
LTPQVISIALAVVGGLFLWLSGVVLGIRLSSKRAKKALESERISAEQQINALNHQLIEESQKAKQAEAGRLTAEGELSGTVVKLGQLEVKMDKARNIINELSTERAVLLQTTPRPSTGPRHSTNPRPSNIPRPATIPKPTRKP